MHVMNSDVEENYWGYEIISGVTSLIIAIACLFIGGVCGFSLAQYWAGGAFSSGGIDGVIGWLLSFLLGLVAGTCGTIFPSFFLFCTMDSITTIAKNLDFERLEKKERRCLDK